MTLDLEVDRTSPVPLYYQLSQQLERAIRSGELKPGDRIETEVELAQRYGLSRPTVRQAIQELVNQGLLVRRRGVGTQVVHAKMHRQVELTSLHDYLDQASHQPHTRVLAHEQVPADATVAEALNVAEGEQVLYLRRVRLAGPEPLALMNNWLPVDLDVMSDDALAQRGLYDLLRSAGVQMRVANQRIGARAATREEARLLSVKVGAPVLTMQRTTFDVAGRAFEYADHAYRSDAYSFETTLVARSGS